MSRLVVVSNRVSLPTERGAKAGGLAVALADAMIPGSLWFGWSGKRSAGNSEKATIVEHRDLTYATVDLSESDYRRFYVGFANGSLWPLLHYRTGLLDFKRDEYEGYLAVNELFAERLAPLLRPDDTIWIHDYQLLTMADALRRRGVRNRIGFFLHIPFVPPAVLHVLPSASVLVRAMTAADLIGFQTHGDRLNFLESVASCMDVAPDGHHGFTHGGHRTHTIVTPIGIDVESFAQTARRASGMAETKRLVESLAGRALALGVDRLDYTKGLPQRFAAFGQLLHRHPEHLRRISFLQIAARSREDVDGYQSLRRELDRKAGDINGAYSDFDWSPLRYMTRAVNRTTIAGFYRQARIGVVTPLRDGMNLVAKEFIAAQDSQNPGVLVLSRFAGAAEDLTEALIVNPYDADAVADAMHEALVMPQDERVSRHATLFGKIRQHTAASFCRDFLGRLERIEHLG
ncbi:MAG: alpha,alpha-trehalose-phosphate synthase (UDP-forming) [Acidiphilium sp.]